MRRRRCRPLRRCTILGFMAIMIATGVPSMSGCAESGEIIPKGYNALKFRQIEVLANRSLLEANYGVVRPLNGVHGSPIPVVEGDASLTSLYHWNNCNKTIDPECPIDGAHVGMVRVGSDISCALSLESMLSFDSEQTLSTDVDSGVLRQHIGAIQALRTAEVLYQATYRPGGYANVNESGARCLVGTTDGTGTLNGTQLGMPLTSLSESSLYKQAAFRVLDDLINIHQLNVGYVEFLDDPIERLGYTADSDPSALHWAYYLFADQVKASFPSVNVGGISYTITDVESVEDGTHPIVTFIDACADQDKPDSDQSTSSPLDFLSFKTRTETPLEAACIAAHLREDLNDRGFDAAELIATAVDVDWDKLALRGVPWLDDEAMRSSFLGAFQASARILMQSPLGDACSASDSGPVSWMINGRIPRVYADLDTLNPSDDRRIIESDYVDGQGFAKPAFMSLFPFRQLADGFTLRQIATGPTQDGIAVMAARKSDASDTLHVVIANSNVSSGIASVTYELKVKGFVNAVTTLKVRTQRATIDHMRGGDSSDFKFRDITFVTPESDTNTVNLTIEMAVPSVHYLELSKVPMTMCESYCALTERTCSEDVVEFGDIGCIDSCEAWIGGRLNRVREGTLEKDGEGNIIGPATGDTIACRTYHLSQFSSELAATDGEDALVAVSAGAVDACIESSFSDGGECTGR